MGCLLISEPGSKELEAGVFSRWLETTRNALKDDLTTDVPCGACNACCRSSFFIHIKPEEKETLSRIPSELLFPAPGLPQGNVLMGFDENGACPMLKEGSCSIYEHRPLTCRSFDCRVLPAAGLTIEGKDKASLADQSRRWRFDLPEDKDTQLLRSVRRAASFLRSRSKRFPPGELPSNPTQLAIMALKVHELFIHSEPDPGDDDEMVRAIINTRIGFDEGD